VPIANGSEEIEAVTIIDVFVRAGATVTIASCNPDESLTCTMSRGVKIVANCSIKYCEGLEFDSIVLPGGIPGAEALRDCRVLTKLLHDHYQRAWVGAICAAPAVVLKTHGILGLKMTCHPGFQSHLPPMVLVKDKTVVIDEQNKMVTSQAPGTTMLFVLTLVEKLFGKSTACEIAAPMVSNYDGCD